MKRIVIVGSCGCGKTTLGKFLAKKLSIPFVDLDELFWLPNWKRRSKEEFSALIIKAVNKNTWIIAGNQSKFRHLIWPKADTIIWIDLPLRILLWRVFERGIRQAIKKETLCNGNRQTLFQFLWMLQWVVKNYRRRRKDYLKNLKHTSHVKWIHLKTVRKIRAFYSQFNSH